MNEAIYKSFTSTVFVSLVTTQVILANCSSKDVMFVVITNIITKKKEKSEKVRMF